MSKLIGDRKFYRKALTVAVPIMIQNGITNFVSLPDNLMIGRVGTEPMSGVAIVNQLMFVSGHLRRTCRPGHLRGAVLRQRRPRGRTEHVPL